MKQALIHSEILEKIVNTGLYYQILAHLKVIRQNKSRDNVTILENGAKIFTKIIEIAEKIYANELIVAGVISLVVGMIEIGVE